MPRHSPRVVSIDTADRASIIARRDALVEANMPLVRTIAERIHRRLPPSFDLDDLISTGYVGLLRAASTYSPKLHPGVPFEAHAYRVVDGWIRNSVTRRRYRDATMAPITDVPVRPLPVLVEARLDESRLRTRIAAAVAVLPPRLRDVIGLYYGEETKLVDIGRRFGVSRECAGQRRTEAIRALRKLLAA